MKYKVEHEELIPPLDVGCSVWTERADMPIDYDSWTGLSVRAKNVLRGGLKVRTYGDLFALTLENVKGAKNSGAKTLREIDKFRSVAFAAGFEEIAKCATPEPVSPKLVRSATSYGSLPEMLVATVADAWKMDDKRKIVMGYYMGLLNSCSAHTLAETGNRLNITRERVRQIAKRISSLLFKDPIPLAVYEMISNIKSMFEVANGYVISEARLVEGVNAAFGWTGTTAFSICRILEEAGVRVVELPEGGGLGLNDDGRFDWVADYKSPTLTERRRAAIKEVLQGAGQSGLTVEEIILACKARYPDLDIGKGNVNGCKNPGNNLDAEGTRMIGFDRGKKGAGWTRYTLNTFFHDEGTVSVLKKAGNEIREYMEQTGLGIVSIWKTWRKFRSKLPHDLPKLGFYMMMRDVKAGGLEYRDYPRVFYPTVDACESAYWWELYEYCIICGRKTATFAEIMSFFTDALGLQPSIALSCAFDSMGLQKVDEEFMSPYEVHSPDPLVTPPDVFLPAINRHLDFSLVTPKSGDINPFYFDENGKALTHRAYAKIFFLSLEENKFSFPEDMLAELLDKGWCNVHLKTGQALLCPTHGKMKPSSASYIGRVFRFGGEEYFVYGNWSPHSKPKFDKFASRVAHMAGIPFEPYDIPGMSASCFEKE